MNAIWTANIVSYAMSWAFLRHVLSKCLEPQVTDGKFKFDWQEEGKCRAWNTTRCPRGKVLVDYTDPQRVNNVELAKNVKIVEPNTTTIYACPVMLDEKQKVSLVFVAPKVLDVEQGDILCSPQAGGIMHKIVKEITDGEY